AALEREGIDVTEVPLFLVLGRPIEGEQGLFQAAQLQLVVNHVPSRTDAPLHVYANRDSVYVSCAGTSLLGRQAAVLAGQAASAVADPAYRGQEMGEDDPLLKSVAMGEVFRTMGPTGPLQQIQAVLAQARREGRELNAEERERLR